MAKRFPVGSRIEVAVCPAEPTCAVLDTGFPAMWHILRRASIVALVAGATIALHEVLNPK
jgi:hypothetical protein